MTRENNLQEERSEIAQQPDVNAGSDFPVGHSELPESSQSGWNGRGRIVVVVAICVAVIAVAISVVVAIGASSGGGDASSQPQQQTADVNDSAKESDAFAGQAAPEQSVETTEPERTEAYKGGLEQAIDDCTVGDLAGFTDVSALSYQKALDNAIAIMGDQNASQLEVDSAEDALQAAFGALEIKFDEDNYQDINYKNVARDPDAYVGVKMKCTGKALQVSESDTETDVRLATDGDYDDVVMVGFEPSILDVRVLEDDELTVYGTCVGLITYSAVLGNEVSIPAIYADKVEIE